MFLRRIAVPAAALAVGAAVIPFAGSASASAPHRLPAQSSSTLVTDAGPATFKTFSSPAAKSTRLQKTAVTASVKSRVSSTGTTIYAVANGACSPETGAGTQADPYCKVQDAVDAAVAGDTVDIIGEAGYFAWSPLTVSTSDISIVGITDQAWIWPTNADSGKPALVLNGVSGVTISNLMLTASGGPTVEVIGSSNITFDSDYIDQRQQSVSDTFTVSGSTGVTVSRTYVDNGTSHNSAGSAVSVAFGSSDITLASDIIAASGIKATGVNGLTVAGSTIQRACAPGIDVEGTTTGVHLEDNVIEDANSQTDYLMGGYKSACTAAGQPWQPDIAVSAAAATTATVDYNDFYISGTDATAPYSWAGTAYPTLAAFQSAVSQGAHDTLDSKEFGDTSFRPNETSNVDYVPAPYSAAIRSANPSVPGELSSDFFGVSPYTTRGAVQFVSPNPDFAVAVGAADTSAHAVRFQAGVTGVTGSLSATVDWGDGTGYQTALSANTSLDATHVYTKLGTYTISIAVDDGKGDIVGNSVAVTTAGSDYTAYGPQRILDTRKGIGTGGAVAKIGANSTLALQVTGAGTAGGRIPSGITAVVLNLTVVNPGSGGYLTAYPNQDPSGAAQSRPASSNVNFSAGQTVPNLAIVPVGKDGVVDLYNGSGSGTDAIADVTGYFTRSAASGYTSLTPARLVDTRKGVGAAKQQVAGNGSIAVQVAGADGGQLPGSAVTAVALNVTAVNENAGGYLTIYPDGGARPTASNLNFSAGQVIANAVIVPVGADGKIDVFNGSIGGADVIVDVVGYYSAAGTSAYLPIAPTRVLDTRSAGAGPLQPGGYVILYSQGSVTDPALTTFVFNTTVANTRGAGYETVAPDPNTLAAYQNGTAVFPTPPTVSTLNWTPGQVVPNLVQAGTGQNGIVDLWNRSSATADLVVDEFGYYQAD